MKYENRRYKKSAGKAPPAAKEQERTSASLLFWIQCSEDRK